MFDPSKPFEVLPGADGAAPRFDPSQPFEVEEPRRRNPDQAVARAIKAKVLPVIVDDAKRVAKAAVEGVGDAVTAAGRLAGESQAYLDRLPARVLGINMDEWQAAQDVQRRQDTVQRVARGQEIKDLGKYYQPDASRDEKLDAQAAAMIGSIAPTIAAAPAGLPVMTAEIALQMGEAERAASLKRGESVPVADARGKVSSAAGAALGVLPAGPVRAGAGALEKIAARGVSGGVVLGAQDAALQQALDGKVDWARTLKVGAAGVLLGSALELPGSVAEVRARNEPYISAAREFGFEGARSELAGNGWLLQQAREAGFKGRNIAELVEWVNAHNDAVNARVAKLQGKAEPAAPAEPAAAVEALPVPRAEDEFAGLVKGEPAPTKPTEVTAPASVAVPAFNPAQPHEVVAPAAVEPAAPVRVPTDDPDAIDAAVAAAAPAEVAPSPGPGEPSAPAGVGTDVAGAPDPASPAAVVKAKPKGKSLGVGTLPNGESDLLNAIEELGGIAPAGPQAGGEYDGYAEVFNRGKARLLRRKGASSVDQLMGELAEYGHTFGSPDEFFGAVTRAIDQREKMTSTFKQEEYGAKFDAALLDNQARKSGTKPPAPISSDDLNVGTTFKVRGEPVKVVSVDPGDGTVRIKDGVTRDLPAGTPIYPDKGTVQHPATVPENDPNVVFESPAEYNVQQAARLNQLRGEAQTRQLTPEENAEIDRIDRSLGQDFMDFYGREQGRLTSLADEQALQRGELQRRSEARLQGADLESQIDLLGPTTDKAGQFSLFEHAAQDYITSKGVTDPIQRASVRSLLQGVWERQAARGLQQDLARDAATAEYFRAVRDGAVYEEAQLDLLPDTAGGVGDVDPGAGGAAQRGERPRGDGTAGGVLGRLDTEQGKRDLAEALKDPARVSSIIPRLLDGQVPVLPWKGMKIATPEDFAVLASTLRNPYQERFGIAILDRQNKIITAEVLTVGTTTSSLVGQEQVARAIEVAGDRAKSYIIWHNHPSGDPEPSPADHSVTSALQKVSWPFGVRMQDHVITNGNRFFSFQKASVLPMPRDQVLPSHAWEAAARENLKLVTRPEVMEEVVRTVRTHGQTGALVVSLNRKNYIVGLDLLDAAINDSRLVHQRAFGAAAYHGATAVLINWPAMNRPQARELRDLFASGDKSIQLLDAGNAQYRSFREIGAFDPPAPTSNPPGVQESAGPYDPEAPLLITDEAGNVVGAQQLGGLEHVKPVEMPELVKLARDLTGVNPGLKSFARARGMFYPHGDKGFVRLDRRVFRDPIQAQKTLAHEIGHAVDYSPDATMERGNLGGRIQTVRNHLASTFALAPGRGDAITAQERKRLYAEAGRAQGKRPSKEDDEGGWAAWGEARRKRYQEEIESLIESRGLTRESVVRSELMDVTMWWRPYDPAKVPESYNRYRESGVELYADALSVLLNAPKELKERAPVFWQSWFNYLDRKPEAKEAFFSLWTFLHRGKLGVLAERNARLTAAFGQGEEIFLAKAAERDARQNTLRGILDTAKQKHFDIFSPIITKARAVKASGRKLPWTEDPEFVFDAHPLADNDNYRLLDRVHKQVIAPLEAAGFTQDDLGLYLFHNRVLNENYLVGDDATGRSVMANPQGITPIQARQALLKMRLDFGPERMTALEGIARKFQDEVFDVIEKGGESGIYSPENVARAKANRYNYAAFAVLDHLEESGHIPAAIRQQRGTLEDIANPFTASLIKALTALKLIEHNTAKRVALKLLRENFAGEAKRAEEVKHVLANGRILTKPKQPPADKEELVVMAEGKPQTWWVEPEIARMFERLTPASAHALVKVLNWSFRNIIYPAFITYNPAFQLYLSPVRDLRRSYVNLPAGVKRRQWLGEQVRTWEAARARLLNEAGPADMARRRQLRALAERRPLNEGEQKELGVLDNRALVIETLATRAIGSPFDSFVRNPTREDYFGRMLQDYQLLPADKRPAWMESNLLKPARALGGWIERTGMTFEAMPKMAAYRVLTRDLGWPAHQAAEYVRNHIGVPNYLRRGQWSTVDGTVMPFINVFMQGLGSDVRQATGQALGPVDPRKQRFEWWRRMAENTLVPRLLQALAAAGVLGAGLKEIYDGAGEYDKANYTVIPLGQSNEPTDSGKPKSVYLRIPEDETARLIGGTIHYLVQKAANGDPAAKASLGDLVAFTGGQLPSVNPVLTLGAGWASYAAGQNPIDQYRGEKVLNNVQFNAGGWEGTKAMLAWTWRETGGANFVRWDPNSDNVAELTVSAIPGLNRLLKVTDAGHRERQQNLEATYDKRNAQIRVAMPPVVNHLLGEYYSLSALTPENRTPVQDFRLKTLGIWHSKVWKPNYELMQQTDDAAQWRATGQALGDMSEAWKK